MPKLNKQELLRYFALPATAATVLLYANHCALKRDYLARTAMAAHLKCSKANPTWAELEDRADSVAYVEDLHKRLARRLNDERASRQKTLRAAHPSQTSGAAASTVPFRVPLATVFLMR